MLFRSWMKERKKSSVKFIFPQKGEKAKELRVTMQNAKLLLSEWLLNRQKRKDQVPSILEQLKDDLNMDVPPRRIEAFDISHLSGTMTVASMVCWKNNSPSNQDYRKFKIRSISGPDDFAGMKEVLTRRYSRTLSEGGTLPDLILIDGGKGQINIAAKVLEELGILNKVDLIGLAKGRSERKSGRSRGKNIDYEYVVKPNQKNEIRMRRNSDVLYFLQNIRDESHRFAIEFQRKLKRKHTLHSKIDDVPGIGPKLKFPTYFIEDRKSVV